MSMRIVTLFDKRVTYLVVIGVRTECVANLLRVRLLALGLESRRRRVGIALQLVTEVLSRRLLGVRLEKRVKVSSFRTATGGK